VFARLGDWLDHRTGFRKLLDVLLLEHIPGGARWRYVWGSALAFVFTVQLITGVLLMTAYSAGDSTAWSSVYFIQYQMDFGWLIRGLHHFGSQTMVVLLGVHMLQVVIAGAHLPPREVNWWLGLGLLATVLGLSLTGYLLPWDQKGYWATQVATNIAGNLPGAGPFLQKVIVGGPVYGHHTLSRFYTLHVAILPPLLIALTIAHLSVFRRHGVTHPRNPVGEGWFWPDQAFRDMLVSMAIFAIMLGLVLYGFGHKVEMSTPVTGSDSAAANPATSKSNLYERWAHAGRDGRGANLDAPADPARPYPARPEWYFLFLFQLLKYFEGDQELIGTLVIPNAVLVVLFLLPLLGYGWMRPFGHVVGVLVVVALLASVGVLTYLAFAADRKPPALTEEEVAGLGPKQREQYDKASLFHEEIDKAEALAARAIELAGDGIPAEGAVYLLRRDPLTRGKRLFGQHCAVCHTHGDDFPVENATASDLEGFGTSKWIRELLDAPASPHYFGRTKLRGMATYAKSAKKKAEKEPEILNDWDLIAKWLAGHPRGDPPKDDDKSAFAEGYRAYELRCSECHTYKATEGSSHKAPDFTGYGDAEWVRLMLMAPAHELRYGARNAMPAFRHLEGLTKELIQVELQQTKDLLLKEVPDDDSSAEARRKIDLATRAVSLSDIDRELIIRWLLKDYRVVFGGEPISGPPKH
jgi:ubiquinol-cytochrome c reductase cytochrome b subunit